MLQLRVSNFEYFKMEPSTDFNSPSQCQHQHHHSYFVKMSKHKFNSGCDCEHCGGYADSMPKDGNGKFSFLFRSTVLVIINSHTHLCNSINRSISNTMYHHHPVHHHHHRPRPHPPRHHHHYLSILIALLVSPVHQS